MFILNSVHPTDQEPGRLEAEYKLLDDKTYVVINGCMKTTGEVINERIETEPVPIVQYHTFEVKPGCPGQWDFTQTMKVIAHAKAAGTKKRR